MPRVTRGTSSEKIFRHYSTMAYMTCASTGKTLLWRGIEYEQRKCKRGPYPATLWLIYRGIKYRPAAAKDQLSWLA